MSMEGYKPDNEAPEPVMAPDGDLTPEAALEIAREERGARAPEVASTPEALEKLREAIRRAQENAPGSQE